MKNEFTWTANHNQAFRQAKVALTTVPTLAFFDSNRKTRFSTDASREGLGFVLQQEQPDKTWALVQAGSRFLTEAESRYAVIELELLTISWAVAKCGIFLAGLSHFRIISDHHPLVPILNSHRLDEIENPRLQRLKIRLMGYNFTAEWRKGKLNNAPDALSRYPVSVPSLQDMHAECDVRSNPEPSIAELRVAANEGKENVHMKEVRRYAERDPVYQVVKKMVLKGFPAHRSQMPEECRRFWSVREHLTVDDDLIVYGCRLLIPLEMRHQTLAHLHESHQGVVRTKQ